MAKKQLTRIWYEEITPLLPYMYYVYHQWRFLDFDFGGHYVAHYSLWELWQDINVLLLHLFP